MKVMVLHEGRERHLKLIPETMAEAFSLGELNNEHHRELEIELSTDGEILLGLYVRPKPKDGEK